MAEIYFSSQVCSFISSGDGDEDGDGDGDRDKPLTTAGVDVQLAWTF
jgi:hypothetical protein